MTLVNNEPSGFGSPEGWYFGVSFDKSGSVYFQNRTAAYDYMWEKSFHNGKPVREVSGWDLQNGGTIVMPFHNNKLKNSQNDHLPYRRVNGNISVKFGNNWYPVSTHVHSHPQIYRSPAPYDPGLSVPQRGVQGSDLDMNIFINSPIRVLYNRQVFEADFYNGQWNILNHWTW